MLLSPYTEYKDGPPWLGAVPAHWRCLPNRAVFREIKDQGHPDEPMLSVTITRGVIRQADLLADTSKKDSSNLDRSKYKLVQPGDIAYNKMRAWQGAAGASQHRGIVSPAYVVQRLRGDDNPEYFHHLLRTPTFAKEAERWSYGITSDMWSLRPEHFKAIYVALPPPAEQAGIVRFLGAVDRKVNRFIRAKRRLIEVLTEQKQAIITHAVTKGLNPSAPLKPSGIDWLGDVPEHWEVKRVKQAANILRGKFTHRPRNDPSFYDGPYPFIQTGGVAQADKYISTWSQTLNERGLSVSKLFPAGTLVMTIAANIGDVAVLAIEACFPDSVVGFVPRAGINRDYMYLVFRCMKPILLREAPVNTQGNLNVERIGAMGVPIPPTAEQESIVARTEQDTAQIDASIAAIKREIDLIREYRTRLVADVVTGKVDVRAAAEAIPDEAQGPGTDQGAGGAHERCDDPASEDDAADGGDDLEPALEGSASEGEDEA